MTSGDFIKYFLIPFFSIFFVFLLKVASRKKSEVSNEDKSVGFEMIIGSTLALFIQIMDNVQKILEGNVDAAKEIGVLLWTGTFFVLMTLFVSYQIRLHGWNDLNGQPVLKRWVVSFSNVLGAITQSLVFFLLTKK
jgi:hypothetical protein